jgi:hypothetical protein
MLGVRGICDTTESNDTYHRGPGTLPGGIMSKEELQRFERGFLGEKEDLSA